MRSRLSVTTGTLALLAFAALLHSTAASSALIPGFHECIFNNHHYTIGEQFHPTVEIAGETREYICILCTCQPTTIAECKSIASECPPMDDCPTELVRVEGECCPICLRPDLVPGPKSCFFQDVEYVHGDRFHPTQASVNSSVNPYCVECECADGNVTCRDRTNDCPALKCDESESFLPDGGCCRECPLTSSHPKRGCQDFDGRYFTEGQRWHPTLEPYGIVPCINCTCVNGKSQCVGPQPCPEVPPCGPDDPVEDVVLCCPKCSSTPTITPPSPTNNTLNVTPGITPCESPYNYKVYKHRQWDCMALENTDTEEVDIYKWLDVGEGQVNRTTWRVTSNDFSYPEYDVFNFIGWVRERRVNGLSRKPAKRRKVEECTSDCAQLVVNMLRTVDVSETLVCE